MSAVVHVSRSGDGSKFRLDAVPSTQPLACIRIVSHSSTKSLTRSALLGGDGAHFGECSVRVPISDLCSHRAHGWQCDGLCMIGGT